jgi:hypothetical protein
VSLNTPLHQVRVLPRAISLIWAAAPRWTAASLGLLAAQSVLPLGLLYLTKLVVDLVAASVSPTGLDFGRVLWLIAGLGSILLLSALCGSLAALTGEMQTQSLTDHVQLLIQAKSVQVDLAYYESAQYHDTPRTPSARHRIARPGLRTAWFALGRTAWHWSHSSGCYSCCTGSSRSGYCSLRCQGRSCAFGMRGSGGARRRNDTPGICNRCSRGTAGKGNSPVRSGQAVYGALP